MTLFTLFALSSNGIVICGIYKAYTNYCEIYKAYTNYCGIYKVYTNYCGILYVIQLSDRVYNVTFPAYDLYSLRHSRREYRA
jgi:hypothetical protein